MGSMQLAIISQSGELTLKSRDPKRDTRLSWLHLCRVRQRNVTGTVRFVRSPTVSGHLLEPVHISPRILVSSLNGLGTRLPVPINNSSLFLLKILVAISGQLAVIDYSQSRELTLNSRDPKRGIFPSVSD